MKFQDYMDKEEILITEAGLSRILKKLKDNFAIITAYRRYYDKKENINRNRELRGEFNKRKMGIYPLVGHWKECQLDNVRYEDCPKNQLKDVIERSFLVIKPDEMSIDEFKNLILSLTKKYNQDGSIISIDSTINCIEKSGNMFPIGTGLSLNKISQGYSQYVKKMNIPFVFECELPGGNIGRQLYKSKGLLYPVVDEDDINRMIT